MFINKPIKIISKLKNNDSEKKDEFHCIRFGSIERNIIKINKTLGWIFLFKHFEKKKI
jgi:hypothetical protein